MVIDGGTRDSCAPNLDVATGSATDLVDEPLWMTATSAITMATEVDRRIRCRRWEVKNASVVRAWSIYVAT
jgi:hypothetical protein